MANLLVNIPMKFIALEKLMYARIEEAVKTRSGPWQL